MSRDFSGLGAVLGDVVGMIESRRGADPEASYVAAKLAKGVEHCAKKVGEEAVETAMAAVTLETGGKAPLVAESADLLFHLLVLWEATGVSADEVAAELRRREGVSGHVEKAGRNQ